MKWHRLQAMVRKEIIQIYRDSRSLLIVIAMPMILMLAFGYGVSFDTKHIPLYVFDRDGTQQSQDLLKRFQASEYFNLVRAVDNYPDLVHGIDGGQCQIGIVVPPDFARRLASGEPVGVQAVLDGTDNNSANLGISYSEAVVQSFSSKVRLDYLQRNGRKSATTPLQVQSRTWFNEDLESMANIVPGVVAIVMAVVGTFLTSLTIAREWERGSMEQLVSTPVTALEVMLGKLAPYVVIGLIDTAICVVMGVWWFKVPFRGEVSVFFFSSLLFLLVVLSMGYVFSVVAKSQLAASQASLTATFLPAFLLSGFIYPIDQMPAVVQVITRAIPARYFMSISRSVFLKGTSLAVLRDDLLSLVIFSVLLTLVATRAFKKDLG